VYEDLLADKVPGGRREALGATPTLSGVVGLVTAADCVPLFDLQPPLDPF